MQYGPTIRSLSVHLTQENMMSYNRVQRFFEEIVGAGNILVKQNLYQRANADTGVVNKAIN